MQTLEISGTNVLINVYFDLMSGIAYSFFADSVL